MSAAAPRALSSRGVRLPKTWEKFPKQVEACDLMNSCLHTLLYGGARSAKTFISLRNVVLRALWRTSEHLVLRLRFSHVKRSIFYQTMPKLLRLCFPNIPVVANKTDWFYELPAKDGGTSRIWLAGTDDPARMERVLGNEYSTLLLEEISQIPWEIVPTLWTRLAEPSGLPLAAYYTCNPPPKRQWAYTLFFKDLAPTGEPIQLPIDLEDPDSELVPFGAHAGKLLMNPSDNPSLGAVYLSLLNSLPLRSRQRYRDGIFLDDVEGALWSDSMILAAEALDPEGDIVKHVVSWDPAVSNKKTSDEHGIVVAGLDSKKRGGICEDVSGKMSVHAAANTVVDAYHAWEANCVVAEVNNGGDMVEAMIHTIDPHIKVVKVRASKGKYARAEPVAHLYERGEVWHLERFPELTEQMTTFVPLAKTDGPDDRMDAVVWALTYLVIGKTRGTFHIS